MKKLLIFCLIVFMLIFSGCKDNNCTEHIDENSDNICDICHEELPIIDDIAPLFVNAVDGRLPTLKTVINNPVDLTQGVRVIDNITKEVKLEVINGNEIDFSKPGVYEVHYKALDEAMNEATAYREVVVQNLKTITYDALVIDGRGHDYVLNDENALKYTSSGARFRLTDNIYVMEKEFFLTSYQQNKNDYSKNGNEIYFPHGALLIIDQNGSLKLFRAGASPVEVNEYGENVTPGFSTSQSTTKEGIFKGIEGIVNSLIPDGGYVIFASHRDDNQSSRFLINNLYSSEFSSGSLSRSDYNMKPNQAKISLEENFEEVVIDDNIPTEILGKVNVTEYVYDGIPLATYNYGDGNKKPVIFFFHGFSGDHVSGIMDKGEELAKRGFFVVAIDAYLHGGRAPEFFQNLSYGQKQQEIVNIQIQTAKDAKHLYEKYFQNDERVQSGSVYAFGVSMGAGSAFYLGTIMEEVVGIVSIVGSPSFYEFYQEKQEFYGWNKDNYYYTNLESYKNEDPLINYERLYGKYIYMGNGTLDTTVPAKYAKMLCEKLDPDYYIYEEYNVKHTSTSEMLEHAYSYLVEHKK